MHRQERKYIVREQTGKGEPKALAEQREILANKLNFASQEAYKLLRTNLMFSTCDEENAKSSASPAHCGERAKAPRPSIFPMCWQKPTRKPC